MYICCNSGGNYYLQSYKNVCPVNCTDESFFLRNLLSISQQCPVSHLLPYPCCFAVRHTMEQWLVHMIYLYYDIGMMSEISFARFSCIIFLAVFTSSLFASAHIALTVAVSEIISDRGITPISSKSLPVS
jgi:hypothetical protein